jgi:DNA-binding protein YbaB
MFNPMQVGRKGAAVAKLAMLQRKITGKKIEVEKEGVKVVATGDGKIKRIEVDGNEEKRIMEAANEAISKAQKYAAEEMQGSMGDLSSIFGK